MSTTIFLPTRRLFLASCGVTAAFFSTRGLFADELSKTPPQTEGPFYPDKLPLDTDNDLINVNDDLTPAVGTIVHLTGKVLDAKGSPLRNAVVEIWQCDNNGAYLHSGSDNGTKRDKHFQGFGRFLTNAKGEYYFRTIKPVPYPGRAPHIHFKIKKGKKELLVTQCYNKGEPQNMKDGIFRNIKDTKARDTLLVDYQPVKGSKVGELAGSFDLVLGVTPESD